MLFCCLFLTNTGWLQTASWQVIWVRQWPCLSWEKQNSYLWTGQKVSTWLTTQVECRCLLWLLSVFKYFNTHSFATQSYVHWVWFIMGKTVCVSCHFITFRDFRFKSCPHVSGLSFHHINIQMLIKKLFSVNLCLCFIQFSQPCFAFLEYFLMNYTMLIVWYKQYVSKLCRRLHFTILTYKCL